MGLFSGNRSLALGGLFSLVLALAGFGCGGGGLDAPPTGGTAGGGSLGLLAQDAPLDNLVKFEITLTSVTLNPGNVSVLPSPVEIELTSLQLQPEMIRLATGIPPGNYTSVTLTFANPEIKFTIPSGSCPNGSPGPVCEVKPPLTNASVTVNVSFSVVTGQLTSLVLDFNLANSAVTDPVTGNITGVNPVVTASLVNVTGQVGEFEDQVGRVVSVNRTSSTSGTFVFEPFSSCQQMTITVNSATKFEDFDEASPPLANSFDSLAAGQIVEVDADMQADTSLLAEKVELADQVMEDEAEGLIVGVTRDAATQEVTQFQMVLLEVAPCTATMPASDTITVNVPSSGVKFRIHNDDLVVDTNLFNDRTDLDVGQKVEVDPNGALGTTITAEEIKLQNQTIRGTVDGAPGTTTFQLNPNADLFPDQSILVQTQAGTRFDDLPMGVASLSAGQTVRVKGLLFRLSAGQQTIIAKRVDGTP